MEKTYTKEQLLQAGTELVDTLIKNCNSTNNIGGFLKEYIAMLTSDDGVYKKLQSAMDKFSESSENSKKEADTMLDTSRANSESLKAICEEFQNLSRSIVDAQKERKELDAKVKKLDERIKEIGNYIRSIQEVSEQTRLLSFNASIEAARAGNAGKGFRIIANEVKTLSGRTSGISGEIEAKVRDIGKEVKSLVEDNHRHDEFMDSIQKTAVTSNEQLTKINNANSENIGFMYDVLGKMQESQMQILTAAQNAEEENLKEVKRIAAKAAQSTIQTGDLLSFMFQLKKLFAWMENHKEIFA